MNETTAVVFIDTLSPHTTVVVWEQADIDSFRQDYSWLEVGYVCYDVEKKEILYRM